MAASSIYSEAAYRTAAASGATHVGLLLLVYDALASDFRKASEALSVGDIGGRCNYSNHAALLLGHLEQWCDLLDDETLAKSLVDFYGHLRTKLLQFQRNGTPKDFSGLASLVAETRAVWQLKEQDSTGKQNTVVEVEGTMSDSNPGGQRSESSSWSA